jgi:hypothetical protein
MAFDFDDLFSSSSVYRQKLAAMLSAGRAEATEEGWDGVTIAEDSATFATGPRAFRLETPLVGRNQLLEDHAALRKALKIAIRINYLFPL